MVFFVLNFFSMKVKIIIAVVTFFFLLSCNKSVKEDFSINIDLVIKKNDSIQLFYSDDGTLNFTEKKSFWKKIKGSPRNQTIKLVIPKNILPNQLRIDFGRNLKQEAIVLNKVELNYATQDIVLKGNEIYTLFRIDESNTILDKKKGTLDRKIPNQVVGPSIYPLGDNLKKRLLLLKSKSIKK